jgi:diadenosine tetraphosphate (Ap4A) HIT family hydrolase
VPETPEAFWERTKDALRTPPVDEWDTWPFAGAVAPRPLEPPVEAEEPRQGLGGIDCAQCERDVENALWYDDNWAVHGFPKPSGLPCVVILHTRRHVDFPDLDDELAAELGPMLIRVQRAVFAVGDIGNVHVCRWGDGSEHFHVWFMARPARLPQLIGSFAAIWDDIVPPTPQEIWDANLAIVRRELNA